MVKFIESRQSHAGDSQPSAAVAEFETNTVTTCQTANFLGIAERILKAATVTCCDKSVT